jgi:hypothetical protein
MHIKLAALSLTRKTQVVITAFGFVTTAALVIYDALPIEVPRNWLTAQLWGIGMVLEVPADGVARLLGLWNTGPRWVIWVLMLLQNSILAFVFGTVLGVLITVIQRLRNWRTNQRGPRP